MRAVTTMLIGANSLLAEGLLRILSNTRFHVAKVVETPDKLPALSTTREFLCIVGGENETAILRHVRHIRKQSPSARIVVLGERCEADSVLVVLQAGASGYMLTAIGSEALLKSFDLVMLNESVLLPWQFAADLWRGGEPPLECPPPKAEPPLLNGSAPTERALSNRETAVVRCLMQGQSNKEIARALVMTETTVKAHLKAILRKIHVRNRTQAVIWAMNNLDDALANAAANGGDTRGGSSSRH